jgi:hypothetical protein
VGRVCCRVHLPFFVINFNHQPHCTASLTPHNHVSTELQKGDYGAWFLDGRAFVDHEGMKRAPTPLGHNQIPDAQSPLAYLAECIRVSDDENCVTAI